MSKNVRKCQSESVSPKVSEIEPKCQKMGQNIRNQLANINKKDRFLISKCQKSCQNTKYQKLSRNIRNSAQKCQKLSQNIKNSIQKCQIINQFTKMSETWSKNVRALTSAQKCQKIDMIIRFADIMSKKCFVLS